MAAHHKKSLTWPFTVCNEVFGRLYVAIVKLQGQVRVGIIVDEI